jgi:hypothetical protein
MPRFILFVIVLGLLGAAAIAVYLSLQKVHRTSSPDLTLFGEGLQRATESEIGQSSLMQNFIELSVKQQDMDSEVERIKSLAAKLGGNAAVNSLSGGLDQDLLVEIPQTLVPRFIAAAQNHVEILPEVSPSSGAKTQVIEVKLQVVK